MVDQVESSQSKGAEIRGNIRWQLEREKYCGTFFKKMEDEICKIKQFLNSEVFEHSSNPENILKSAKKFQEKLIPKEDTSITIISELLIKIQMERKSQSNTSTFLKLRYLLNFMACSGKQNS